MNILVTGGSGFIGHKVSNNLVSQGHKVTIIDKKINYGDLTDQEFRHLLIHRRVNCEKHYNFDILENGLLTQVFYSNKFDIVIHCASPPRQKIVQLNPQYSSRVMIEGLINLLELSVKHKVPKFVFISSSMVYGNFVNHTIETTVCQPIGTYGILKLAGEQLVKDFYNDYNYTIIRPSAVYGPCDSKDRVIAKFLFAAMNDSEIIVNGKDEHLDFSYIDDVANGICLAALSDNSKNKVYNITRSESIGILYAAKLIISLVGKGKLVVKDRQLNFPSRGSLTISKARKDFGYEPAINIEQGLKLYYDWLRNSVLWSSTTI